MMKSLRYVETLISCNVANRFYYLILFVFHFDEYYQEFNMTKSEVIVFKIVGNWESFPLQTRYLVKKSTSTCCAHHVEYLHWFWTGGLVSYFD